MEVNGLARVWGYYVAELGSKAGALPPGPVLRAATPMGEFTSEAVQASTIAVIFLKLEWKHYSLRPRVAMMPSQMGEFFQNPLFGKRASPKELVCF